MSSPIYKEIFLIQGVDFTEEWSLRAPRSLEPRDLTGYTVTGTFKRSLSSDTGYDMGASLADADDGLVGISILGEDTRDLKPGRYFFDVLAYGDELPTQMLFSGIIHMDAAVTKIPLPPVDPP